MATLAKLIAREILDSRGDPTVEVEAVSSCGAVGRASVPTGANPGRHEAVELRDERRRRYGGRGVRGAVGHAAGEIARAVAGMDLDDQAALDAALIALDGTPDRARLGANATLGVSLAVAHAAAAAHREELFVHLNRLYRRVLGPGEAVEPVLPMPMVSMISGGLHAGANLDFQDFLMIPLGARDYAEALEMAGAVYRAVGEVLRDRREESRLVADLGGYGPRLRTNAQAVDRILEAALACGLEPGRDVAIALDVAASNLFDPESRTYCLSAVVEDEYDAQGMVGLLEHWVRQYPIASIEDGLADDDWDGWAALTRRLGGSVQLVGDDLFASRPCRLKAGAERGAGNAILVAPGQVGTLSETLETLAAARRSGYRAVIGARSGETEDATIADLAVATGAGQIKVGSLTRSERLAKYNRLTRIAEHLGPAPPFAGRAALGF